MPGKVKMFITVSTFVGTFITEAAEAAAFGYGTNSLIGTGLGVVASANPVVLGGGVIVGTVVVAAVVVNHFRDN